MANMFSRIIRSILGNKISDDVIAKNQASDDADGKHYIDFDLIEKTEFIFLIKKCVSLLKSATSFVAV